MTTAQPSTTAAWDLRARQTDAIVRMLHPSASNGGSLPGRPGAAAGDSDAGNYKVLILDATTKDVIAPLLRVADLRRHGVTLHLQLTSRREAVPDAAAIYFIAPGEAAADAVAADAAAGLYATAHLNWCGSGPPRLLDRLATALVAAGPDAPARIASVADARLGFQALEPGLFSLGLRRAFVDLHAPSESDGGAAAQAVVAATVEGLFAVCVTLGGPLPVIRAPAGGAAAAVGAALADRLREHARTTRAPASQSASLTPASRPVLALFDRAADLGPALAQPWAYQPLVADVLGLRLNRVALPESPAPGAGAGPAPPPGAPPPPGAKTFEVGPGDWFWEAHGSQSFPDVAAAVDAELKKYKAAVDEVNRRAAGGGGGAPAAAAPAPSAAASADTQGLAAAVATLPELAARKAVLDRHTNLATHLLRAIQARGLDAFHAASEELLAGLGGGGGGQAGGGGPPGAPAGGADPGVAAVERALASGKGAPSDGLRLALVWALSAPSPPSDADARRVLAALDAAYAGGSEGAPPPALPAGAAPHDPAAAAAALAYARRLRRLNAGGGSAAAPTPAPAAAPGTGEAALLGALGAGLSQLTRGVRSLLLSSGERAGAVVVAVEALCAGAGPAPPGAPPPAGAAAVAGFATFDPAAPPGTQPPPAPPARDAVVFVVGGGCYAERAGLARWAAKAGKRVLYGATDLLPGGELAAQLAELGARAGAGF